MNNENESKTKVLFLQKDDKGQRFGSGQWTETETVYVKNFRMKNDMLVADVDKKTDETYINKQGKEVTRHAICGMLVFKSQEEAIIVVEMNGKKEKLSCSPRNVVGRSNGREYIVLDFNTQEVNPYAADLGLVSNQEMLDSIPDDIF